MMRISGLIGAASLAVSNATQALDVEQIHISYSGVVGSLAVDFVSASQTGWVLFTADNANWTNVSTTSFAYPAVGWMHQATMDFGLTTPGAAGSYRACSPSGCTDAFTVTPVPARGQQEVFAVLADFGYANDVCMKALIEDANAGGFDAVLHAGDFAYNFETDNSTVGNSFMNDIQGYAATKPVMPAPGNHEACDGHSATDPHGCPGVKEIPQSTGNFSHYKARFQAVTLNAGAKSGSNNNIFYSFNEGLTHFIVFSAEAYLYAVSPDFLANQLAFMKADLAAVDRSVTPWVVGIVHKDWSMEAQAYGYFAPILEAAKVDFVFVGHVHYYNRQAPYAFSTGKIDMAAVSADKSTYTNPKYPTYVVTGAPGDREGESKCDASKTAPPSLTCSSNYGYGYYQALNATHATWSFKTIAADGSGPKDFADHLLIINENH